MALTAAGLAAGPAAPAALPDTPEDRVTVRLKMSFNGHEAVIGMYDNPAAEQVLALLPAQFSFSDFAGEEKIARFARPLDLSGAPGGLIARSGRVFIYRPWGNLGIFYRDHGSTPDQSLIPLGEVQSGLDFIRSQAEDFNARLEIIE